MSPKTHRPGNLAEVRVLQIREDRLHARCLILDIDEAELAVVIYGDLDRQLLLNRRQEITQQHGKPAIASETDHLSAWLALLQPERRWHAVRHRAMEQASEGSTLAVGVDVPKHPDQRRTVVGRK